MIFSVHNRLRRLRDDTSGAAMIEFAIALPILLLVLAVIVEGSRITWTHQAAASGVRDAARYFARTQVSTICENSANVDAFNNSTVIREAAEDIVVRRVGDLTNTILPRGVRDVTVRPNIDCTSITYSGSNSAVVPVVAIEITLTIDFPFGGVFGLFGQPLEPLVTTISDESRVFGI